MTKQEEKDYREHLQATLKEGSYQIGDKDGLNIWTGKGGAIDYLVCLRKTLEETETLNINTDATKRELSNSLF